MALVGEGYGRQDTEDRDRIRVRRRVPGEDGVKKVDYQINETCISINYNRTKLV